MAPELVKYFILLSLYFFMKSRLFVDFNSNELLQMRRGISPFLKIEKDLARNLRACTKEEERFSKI